MLSLHGRSWMIRLATCLTKHDRPMRTFRRTIIFFMMLLYGNSRWNLHRGRGIHFKAHPRSLGLHSAHDGHSRKKTLIPPPPSTLIPPPKMVPPGTTVAPAPIIGPF
mmetsp:Transcript_13931/g.28448  ORF Transcript_13931/g.28448 Transcript_13931/m.28448 type:complete len:107 (+) Transcript_13931:73-393(+)